MTLLGLAQPLVSKHLRMLREVGLVEVRDEGRHRVYRMNAAPLRSIHAWVSRYERAWEQRFARMDAVLDELKDLDEGDDDDGEHRLRER